MCIEKPTMWRPEDLKTWPVLLEAGHETSLPKLQCARSGPDSEVEVKSKNQNKLETHHSSSPLRERQEPARRGKRSR